MKTDHDRKRIPQTLDVYHEMKKHGFDRGADYIWKELGKYIASDYVDFRDTFIPSNTPAGMFIFNRTPQGRAYWSEVLAVCDFPL